MVGSKVDCEATGAQAEIHAHPLRVLILLLAHGGPQTGSTSSAFHFCQRPASSFTFSGCFAARSVCSPMSSFRLNSFAPSTVAFSRRDAAPPPPARPPPVAAFTSFQSPARIAICPPNRQYSAACGASVFSPRRYGSRFTPSSFPSGLTATPAAARAVGRRSSWMTGWSYTLPAGSFPFSTARGTGRGRRPPRSSPCRR